MHSRLTLLCALPLALAACNNQDPANDTTGRFVETTAVEQGVEVSEPDDTFRPDASAEPETRHTDADRGALGAIEVMDRQEVAAAEGALAKNLPNNVRRYAETVRDAHVRNLEATRRLMGHGVPGAYAAQAAQTPAVQGEADAVLDAENGAGTGAALDAATTAGTQRRLGPESTRLAALDDEAFTTAWLDVMVKRHEDALAHIDALLPDVQDEEVARHLRRSREAVAAHFDTARELQRDR